MPLILFACVTYLIFLVAFLYAIAFVGNLPAPKTIDSGMPGPVGAALAIDTLLLGIFAIQHSVMARPAFKRWWTRLVPEPVERATYVLLSSLSLLLLYWLWRPIPDLIWSATNPAAAAVLESVSGFGWGLALLSTFLIDHFELLGLRQVYARLRGEALPPPAFKTPFLYRNVRHPLYLGFLIAFWATPAMTAGHLLFAIATTGYVLIGIQLEERDLIALFGDRYRRYRREVSMLVPLPGRKAGAEGPPVTAREVDPR